MLKNQGVGTNKDEFESSWQIFLLVIFFISMVDAMMVFVLLHQFSG